MLQSQQELVFVLQTHNPQALKELEIFRLLSPEAFGKYFYGFLVETRGLVWNPQDPEFSKRLHAFLSLVHNQYELLFETRNEEVEAIRNTIDSGRIETMMADLDTHTREIEEAKTNVAGRLRELYRQKRFAQLRQEGLTDEQITRQLTNEVAYFEENLTREIQTPQAPKQLEKQLTQLIAVAPYWTKGTPPPRQLAGLDHQFAHQLLAESGTLDDVVTAVERQKAIQFSVLASPSDPRVALLASNLVKSRRGEEKRQHKPQTPFTEDDFLQAKELSLFVEAQTQKAETSAAPPKNPFLAFSRIADVRGTGSGIKRLTAIVSEVATTVLPKSFRDGLAASVAGKIIRETQTSVDTLGSTIAQSDLIKTAIHKSAQEAVSQRAFGKSASGWLGGVFGDVFTTVFKAEIREVAAAHVAAYQALGPYPALAPRQTGDGGWFSLPGFFHTAQSIHQAADVVSTIKGLFSGGELIARAGSAAAAKTVVAGTIGKGVFARLLGGSLGLAVNKFFSGGFGAVIARIAGSGIGRVLGGAVLGTIIGGPVGAVVGFIGGAILTGPILKFVGGAISSLWTKITTGGFIPKLDAAKTAILSTFGAAGKPEKPVEIFGLKIEGVTLFIVAILLVAIVPNMLFTQSILQSFRTGPIAIRGAQGGKQEAVDFVPGLANPNAGGWPTAGCITQGPFAPDGLGSDGKTIKYSHRSANAIDIGASLGTPVSAVLGGTVTRVVMIYGPGQVTCATGRSSPYTCRNVDSYGNVIEIRGTDANGNSYTTRYAHLLAAAPGVRNGATVTAGQTIGYVDDNGYSTGPHLHFEYIGGGRLDDPRTTVLPNAVPPCNNNCASELARRGFKACVP